MPLAEPVVPEVKMIVAEASGSMSGRLPGSLSSTDVMSARPDVPGDCVGSRFTHEFQRRADFIPKLLDRRCFSEDQPGDLATPDDLPGSLSDVMPIESHDDAAGRKDTELRNVPVGRARRNDPDPVAGTKHSPIRRAAAPITLRLKSLQVRERQCPEGSCSHCAGESGVNEARAASISGMVAIGRPS